MNTILESGLKAQRSTKFLMVHVGKLRFLISLSGVRKIVPAQDLDYEDFAIDGFVATKSIDDEVFPIIDIASRFEDSRLDPIPATACLIVMDALNAPLSLLVEAIGAVHNLKLDDMNKTGVLESAAGMPGCIGFARFGDESFEVFDPIHLATEHDREAVKNWRGSRAAIRRIKGLDREEKIVATNLTAEQEEFAGTYLLVRVGETVIALRTCDIVEGCA